MHQRQDHIVNHPANDPTPRSKSSGATRLIGTIVIAFLLLAIILLAVGVVNFEQLGFF